MLPKIFAVLVGVACMVAAAARQSGPGYAPEMAQATGFLAAFGITNVLCAGFLGGFTGRFGTLGVVNTPAPRGVFTFLGWTLLAIAAGIAVWLVV